MTIQRGPGYTRYEADILISGLRKVDSRMGDAVEFIRATGCRTETLFNRSTHYTMLNLLRSSYIMRSNDRETSSMCELVFLSGL